MSADCLLAPLRQAIEALTPWAPLILTALAAGPTLVSALWTARASDPGPFVDLPGGRR